MGAAFTTILHKRLNKGKAGKKQYEQTDLIPNETKTNSTPDLPETGLPEGGRWSNGNTMVKTILTEN